MPRKRSAQFILVDSAFSADPKFLKLLRRAKDPVVYAECIGVWLLALATARRAKSPRVDWSDFREEGCERAVQLLIEVGLVTDEGFDPDAFDDWGPAYRSPHDARRGGDGGNGGVRKAPDEVRKVRKVPGEYAVDSKVSEREGYATGTQGTQKYGTSTPISSLLFSSQKDSLAREASPLRTMVDGWVTTTNRFPTPKQESWLMELHRDHGAERSLAVIEDELRERGYDGLLGRATGRLRIEAKEYHAAEDAARLRAAHEATEGLRRRIALATPEEIERAAQRRAEVSAWVAERFGGSRS
jgi:hypothetical protein